MPILFDYFTLKIIWWLFVGALLIGFAIMDGFDLGVGTLLPFVAKTDGERRVMINNIGPTWEGNQVWFITGGGALFAAWPLVYSAAFSGFYWALLLVLFALFFRPVGFEYRSKVADPRWRSAWDWGLFVGGAVPSLVFGVAFGNLLQRVPFTFDDLLRPCYSGSFFGLLNPFALLTGVVSLSMLVMHGAVYLQMRTEGKISGRARAAALAGTILTAGFAMFPFVMPSSTFPNASLTVYDAVSSHRTLNLMFVAVVLFLPVALLYTSWVYSVLRGKVTEKRIKEETHPVY
jgi:cytochrome d ubiquinol oxidase subunit II